MYIHLRWKMPPRERLGLCIPLPAELSRTSETMMVVTVKLEFVSYQLWEELRKWRGTRWALTMRQKIGSCWKYIITLHCLYNPGYYILSIIGYWRSERKNYVRTWHSWSMILWPCAWLSHFPPLAHGLINGSGRWGSQLHHWHISLNKLFIITEFISSSTNGIVIPTSQDNAEEQMRS